MDTVVVLLVGFIIVTCIITVAIMISTYIDTMHQKKEGREPDTELRQEPSYEIIRRAMKQADAMIVRAELDSIQTVAQKKLESRHFEELFEKELGNLIHEHVAKLEKANEMLSKGYETYMLQAQHLIEQTVISHKEHLAQTARQLEEKTHASYELFFAEQRKRISDELEQQVAKTNELVNEHRKLREQIHDEKVASLVVEATKLVLKNGLDMETHTKLILDSLAEAQKQGVLK